ncbi:molybdopterin-containing oxidoreductase family protein [Allorhizocola rhizosphaerae]|uniref:molybdopterin-containing oxidoreductase family protein n=1 Tax=Allorhizocola rhizosphaerae TaxID=1872709 RepID=UPI002482675E|nr:molybdopterin-dependent oxidoreductase [Allorhizocola rhizosphaerae]
MGETLLRKVIGACPHDCPDRCSWVVTVEEETGKAIALQGNANHPLTAGRLCGKVAGYLDDRVYSRHRLTTALKRCGPKGSGQFTPIGLAEALDEVADRLGAVAAQYGPEAIVPFSYEGTQGLLQSKSMSERFFARLGATELGKTICGPTGGKGINAVNGTSVGVLPEDAIHSRYVVVWGANPVVTTQHLWPVMLKARARGAKIVVIDPVATRTANAADWHLAPRPGTDAALALCIAHVLIAKGLTDAEWISQHTTGYAELAEAVQEFTVCRTAQITGLREQDIETLALEYGTVTPSLIRLLVGMEHQAHGAAAYSAIACLPSLTGAWRHHGGGIAYHTSPHFMNAFNMDGLKMPHLAPGPRRQINMVRLGQALVDPDLDPPVKALFVHGSNPAVIVPRQPLVRQGLQRDDLYTVVHEHVLTDTARYADIVLPATTQVEHLDIMKSWGHIDLTLNLPAVAPPPGCIGVTELFRQLAARMGFTEPCFADTDEQLLATALDSDHPYLAGITVESLRAQGWQRLRLPQPWIPFANGFPTPDGRARLSAGAAAAATTTPTGPSDNRFPLRLLSVKGLHSINSTYADTGRAQRRGGPWIDLHPDDAAPRSIGQGDPVSVHNQHGSLTFQARLTCTVPPGVASAVFGAWSNGDGPGCGPCLNLLTGDELTEAGGSSYQDTFVEVARQW